MNLYKHIVEQPFVMATGLAALVHSTWSLGTLFSGQQPQAGLTVEFVGWIVPAFLIAFAMDVGQIVTSSEIRAGHRTRAKYATFAVFAVSTYYLQWLYIAHHMPQLALADGVREQWSGLAMLVRDAAVWIIPAFLPLSTLMYTFSSEHEKLPTALETPVMSVVAPVVERPQPELLPFEVAELPTPILEDSSDEHQAKCEACGWKKTYTNPDSAARGLATHLSRHCTAMHPEMQHTNGNGAH